MYIISLYITTIDQWLSLYYTLQLFRLGACSFFYIAQFIFLYELLFSFTNFHWACIRVLLRPEWAASGKSGGQCYSCLRSFHLASLLEPRWMVFCHTGMHVEWSCWLTASMDLPTGQVLWQMEIRASARLPTLPHGIFSLTDDNWSWNWARVSALAREVGKSYGIGPQINGRDLYILLVYFGILLGSWDGSVRDEGSSPANRRGKFGLGSVGEIKAEMFN
jgi:hypothetical protein